MIHNALILLIRRIKAKFGDGLYSCIGGKVEPGEASLNAIIREAIEEIDVQINSSDFELVHTTHRQGSKNELVLLFFKTDKWSGELHNNEPEKHTDMGWLKINKLPDNIISDHRQAPEPITQKISYSEHRWNK